MIYSLVVWVGVFKINVGCLSICSLSCIRDVGVSPVEMREWDIDGLCGL